MNKKPLEIVLRGMIAKPQPGSKTLANVLARMVEK